MKRLLTLGALALALCLACAAPVAADTSSLGQGWPVGLTDGTTTGMYEVTASWDGGSATVLDAAWLHGVDLLKQMAPSGGIGMRVTVRFVPGLGYDGRLGG